VTLSWSLFIQLLGYHLERRIAPRRNWMNRCIQTDHFDSILCLWFRASLIYINNCPTRCNTKLSIYYSASSLYMFRASTTPIISITQNSNCNLRYWSRFLCSYYLPAAEQSLKKSDNKAKHGMKLKHSPKIVSDGETL